MAPLSFQPVPHHPALYIPPLQMLVIADLHIGIEHDLYEHGVHAADITPTMFQQLENICKEMKPKKLMILGDIKHSIPNTPYIEQKRVYRFLENLQQHLSIHIIPGNHDGNLSRFVPTGVTIHPSQGIIIQNYAFMHGHRWPHPALLKATYLLMAHSHPTVALKDRLSYTSYEPCWVKTKLLPQFNLKQYPEYNPSINILILPAFNPLTGGFAVNEDGIMGPLAKSIDKDNAEVFLLDGTAVGKIKHLQNNSNTRE